MRSGIDGAVETALLAERLAAVAEEMGGALQRAAFSANVKERLDFSCAVFLADGSMVAQAAHIPVHLGAMPLSVAAVREDLDLGRGDEAIVNDPFRGGTHLPDITLVRPVFLTARSLRPEFFVANRAHHADVGGATPGSMGIARDVFAEGIRIPPVLLTRNGVAERSVWRIFLSQVREPDERLGDLRAQQAANHVGARRLEDLAHGSASAARELVRGAGELPRATARALSARLRELPRGTFRCADRLDDDGFGSGPLPIRVAITPRGGRARVDFTGTAPQQAGPVNAHLAVTLSAVGYCFRCLLGDDVPMNGGILAPIEVVAPAGCLVNAVAPAAVAAGNVETSQRIVDVVMGALSRAIPGRIPAASAGTMTNLSFGSTAGGSATYYETLAGGAGATRDHAGQSAVQTHMTNTRNTPIEMLEAALPLHVARFAVRRGSGGRGRRAGGDGIVKEIVARAPIGGALLAERHVSRPSGADGGGPGKSGAAEIVSPRARSARRLAAKCTFTLGTGDRLRVETPGGGGHGSAARKR